MEKGRLWNFREGRVTLAANSTGCGKAKHFLILSENIYSELWTQQTVFISKSWSWDIICDHDAWHVLLDGFQEIATMRRWVENSQVKKTIEIWNMEISHLCPLFLWTMFMSTWGDIFWPHRQHIISKGKELSLEMWFCIYSSAFIMTFTNHQMP